ncbi:MAG: hypothetical protein ACUZ8O_07575 [Candidatus Anammoxibacter sp.]
MRYLTLIILLISCLAVDFVDCGKAAGATTKFWKQNRYKDFSRGNVNNVALHSNGNVMLAPKTEDITGINASYVWCMAMDQYGNIFAGTGNPGVVYKITKQKKAIEIFRLPEGMHVLSMVTDNNGNIYVGTAPKGIIYKINNEMETDMFRDLPATYIWDLVTDNNGNLFAATGNNGKIYRIHEGGEAEVILDSEATHILDMEIDANNVIFACSEPFGLIYKITPKGKISVLFDAKEEEVHCITLGNNGTLYAGTASGGKPHIRFPKWQMPKMTAPIPANSSNSVSNGNINQWADFGLVDKRLGDGQAIDTEDMKAGKWLSNIERLLSPINLTTKPNVVYRILPNGNAQRILKLDEGFILSIISNNANRIYLGTGNKATIYQIEQPLSEHDELNSTEQITTLFNVESSQVLSLLKIDDNKLYVGTGNNGSVFKISNEFSTSGIYESSIHDASINAKWGRISWNTNIKEGTTITLFTRTGNSKKPDRTWSNWQASLTAPPIEETNQYPNEISGIIQSPPARLIQYKAEFTTINKYATPILKDVSISYLPDNQPPEISNVSIKNNGNSQSATSKAEEEEEEEEEEKTEEKPDQSTADKNNNTTEKIASQLITWDVKDPDNDQLLCTIFFKDVNETNWRLLAKDIQGQNSYTWETDSIDDAKYQIKILVSDRLDNPIERELQTEMISRSFIIDNTKPEISNIRISKTDKGNYTVTGTVSDNMSNISSMRYSVDVDTENWTSVFPIDRLFDYRNENFSFTVSEMTKGKHSVTINTTDAEENKGSAEISIEVK